MGAVQREIFAVAVIVKLVFESLGAGISAYWLYDCLQHSAGHIVTCYVDVLSHVIFLVSVFHCKYALPHLCTEAV